MDAETVPIHLCVLTGNAPFTDLKTSVSCLRGHPGVRVTLACTALPRAARRLARYTRRRHGNIVELIASGQLPRFGHRSEATSNTYIVFLPGGDWLSDDALGAITEAAQGDGPDVIYFDQDHINRRGHLCEPLFKPDASYEYFMHLDYVGALLCIKSSTLAEYGGMTLDRYPMRRYELLLRAFSEQRTILHIPRPCYHSRAHPLLDPPPGDAAAVLKAHLARRKESAQIIAVGVNTQRVKRGVTGSPRISIVVPFRDKPGLLRQCLEAIIDNTHYRNLEVIGISNRSQSLTVYRLMKEFSRRDPRIRFCEHNIPFNFSALVNHGVRLATGEYIVLMNNDISVINHDWLDAMLEHGQRKEVGVVGAKLLFPDGTVQHAGLSIQQSGYVGHLHKRCPADSTGYMNRLICAQNVSAVTGALCLFHVRLHHRLGGFDESRFKIAFNDVDFCLRAESLGYVNVFTPYATAYHHESLSRGYEETARQRIRFEEERLMFVRLYQSRIDRGDPYYNPNLDQHRDDFSY